MSHHLTLFLFVMFLVFAVMHQFAAHLICLPSCACHEAVVAKRLDRFLGS